MKKRLLLSSLIFSFACANEFNEPIVVSDSIVNGEFAEPGAFPAVGMLFFGGSLCTGTLIRPDFVLTAAHCTAGQDANSTSFFIGNGGGAGFQREVPAKALFTHQQFLPNNFSVGNDIALVELAEEVTDIAPIPFNIDILEDTLNLDSPEVCDLSNNCFTAVGFGDTDGGSGDAGSKRFANIRLTGFDPEHIIFGSVADPNDPNTCQGDSGGPALMTINGELRVIAVTSGGDIGCRGESFSQRTDSDFEEFLKIRLEGGIVPEEEHCIPDGTCEAGCGLTDEDCFCRPDGFCQPPGLCPAGISKDPDCTENANDGGDDGGCAVSTTTPSSQHTIFGGLLMLAFAVLGLRRKKS